MTSANVVGARRNACILGATGLTVGALFLFPTSTNRDSSRLARTPAAPAGVVSAPPTTTTPSTPPVRIVNGRSVDTRYGPVQVQVRVRSGRILSVTTIDYPQGSDRDREINDYAVPILQQETVSTQSARIDTVSGATYTSDGYVRSLQSALDAAHA